MRLRSVQPLSVGLVLLGSGCAAGGTESSTYELSEVLGFQSGADTGVPLFRVRGLALAGAEIVATEAGNHRVVRLAKDLGIIESFGREGSGPSEFRVPSHVVSRAAEYAVSDVGLGRISFFTPSGELLRQVTLPGAADHAGQFIISRDGSIFVASLSDEFYLLASEDGERWEPFARRFPPTDEDLRRFRRQGAPKLDLVSLVGADTLLVFDNRFGRLVAFTSSGEPVKEHRLPSGIVDRLRDRDERLAKGLGRSPAMIYSPLVKSISVGDDGGVFLFFTLGDTIGAVLDRGSGSLSYVLDSSNSPARSARSAVLSGDTLITAAEDGVRQYRVTVRP